MLPELGHFALILALCLCLLLGTFPLYGAANGNARFMGLARPLVAGIFVFIGLAYVLLTYSFAIDDFSVTYIQQHSNSLLPFRYKLTAVWGGHEGSFLLWTFMLAGWMLAVAIFSRSMPLEFVARVLGVLGLLSVGYLLFMLATSNPFDRIVPLPPADGADLNSALQDFGFIVHPPTLYMGYVGFSVVFAFAMAALLSGRLDAAWARWCRPWANVAWAILTIGIALGSWWAYYELGWGGWWAWDPVENPPLITWLFGTALIHSLAVTEKRGIFKSWTVMLAILAFAGSLLGTFITRSGLLTSVHAFATDPERGVFILAILTLSVGGALLLFALRAPLLRGRFGFGILSREMLLLVNNLILVVSAASVFLGTLFPMVYQALTDDLISIGPPYFNAIFVPLMALLALVLGVGPISRWKKTSGRYLFTQLLWVGVISLGLGIVLPLAITLEFGFGPTITIALALWILLSAVRDIKNKVANKKTLSAGLASLPLSYYGMQIAHLGVAIMVVGAALTSVYSTEKSVLLSPGERMSLGGYAFEFVGAKPITGPNFRGMEATLDVYRGDEFLRELHPERRLYLASGTPSTEMAIDAGFWRDLFVTLGEEKGAASWSMTIYVKPFVRWVWLGAIFMCLGGVVAAGDKRYRRALEKLADKKQSVAVPSTGSAEVVPR
ncbi:MAG: heme lyase CcmF/NrfE family subunit [Proteobacteria bacterium]|nr:heme lyase CcmF/NrfE family subunit [Pseudomonadales bacterium]MBL6804167.1 heme lyase CcmF/NrfE family subunit [Pseudomonadales bacterium]MDA0804471.1 heme lyase CcmF/NrfE family subunit [Pseudomonadota bacterium]MDA0895245.1 heme lyase CcmF/NrfE family subunit [Pseudomonadota bacterium]MDA1243658.1 heme lyase CcmF/NrfE family subunit [Pseudomonadota bacterium]